MAEYQVVTKMGDASVSYVVQFGEALLVGRGGYTTLHAASIQPPGSKLVLKSNNFKCAIVRAQSNHPTHGCFCALGTPSLSAPSTMVVVVFRICVQLFSS